MTRAPVPDPDADSTGGTAHGARSLASVTINSYSLEIEDEHGLVGDRASQTAFRELLAAWRTRLDTAGRDPLGPTPSEQMSKTELDRIARSGDTEAARTIANAVDEFSGRLAGVIERFHRKAAWRGVQRIAIGGGFKESDIGRLAIRLTAQRLAEAGTAIELRPLHAAADDAGLLGWVHGAPPPAAREAGAILAVDIGGTNVRCGIVAYDAANPADLACARVVKREKWCHADDDPARSDLVEGIVAMLRRLIAHAGQHGIALGGFLGVSCPGIICSDGSIDRGAQNLPGDWNSASFHLPRRLCENLPLIGSAEPTVRMHNDAVVQGLSERPFMNDVRHWAVLTIGTGLGNASFTNMPSRRTPSS